MWLWASEKMKFLNIMFDPEIGVEKLGIKDKLPKEFFKIYFLLFPYGACFSHNFNVRYYV